MRVFSFRQTKLAHVCAGVLMGSVLANCAVLPNGNSHSSVYQLSGMGVSQSAASTKSEAVVEYAGPNEMLENADMAAFMLAARDAYVKSEKQGAWGFAVIDMMLAAEYEQALTVLNEMPDTGSSWTALSSDYLRSWVLAAKGDTDLAKEAMRDQKKSMPNHTFRGYQALLLEGMGLYEEALGIYEKGPDFFENPSEDNIETAEQYRLFITQSLAYNAERILALRHADLLMKLERNEQASIIYKALLDANEDDAYARARMKEIDSGDINKKPFHVIHSGLGVALADQAELIQQRETFAGVVLAKGAKSPFNHFLSSLRQTASLLDPTSLEIRQIEAEHLYSHGFFEAAARFALDGNIKDDDARASLLIRASEAYLEAGKTDRMESLNQQALGLTDEPFTLLSVADLMVRMDDTDRAEALIGEILLQEDLEDSTRAYANILLAENHQQAGDMTGAFEAARQAVKADESDQTRGFLAATLSKTPETREEGLSIYRELFIDQPNNPAMMNNFGYALVESPETSKELDEGFRLLKKANRITPFEPNLLDSLGWAYYQYGDYERALELISKAVEIVQPFDHWEFHAHLGDVYWRLDQKELAKTSWQSALDRHPPALNREEIALRLESGLTEDAPEERDPPFVPKNEAPPETRSI